MKWKLVLGFSLAFAGGLAAGVLWGPELGAWLGVGREPSAHAGDHEVSTGQLWTCGMHPQVIQDRPGTCPICGMALTPVAGTGAARQEGGERDVAYWWDPMMSPPYISDEPGMSPMGMELVPVYADEASAGAGVTIDPSVVQNMGVRVEPVVEAPLARDLRAVGILREPEPAQHEVNLRVGGWIQRLFADTEGMLLAAGDPLFELYSPELQVAVEELIGARRMLQGRAVAEHADAIRESAARKLELYGLERAQVEELAALERAPATVTFRSPAAGYLVEKSVFQGSAVMAGDTVMRIADTSTLWLDLQVFEKDLPHVRLGQEAVAAVDGRPGERLRGAVTLVHPRIDPLTRTALVRVEVENPTGDLRQGMFATADLRIEIAPRALVVPREAIIDTGTRQVAFVALGEGHFEPRRVELGARGGEGLVQVLSGLAPGEKVVTSGQFLLDAESRMRESIQRFLQQKEPAAAPAAAADVLKGASTEWERAADNVLEAYLEIARELGAPQESDRPVDPGALLRATASLRAHARGSAQEALADRLAPAAAALEGRPLDDQRELFEPLSEAAIELAARSPRSGEAPATLYVAYCPMVPARWLQADERIANPYYANEMKACGEIERELPAPAAGGSAGGERR